MPSTAATPMINAARAMHGYLRHQLAATRGYLQTPGINHRPLVLETIELLRQYNQHEDTTLETALREWDPVKANKLEDHSLQLDARLTRLERRVRAQQQMSQPPDHATLVSEWEALCARCERHWQHKTDDLIPWINERIRVFKTLAEPGQPNRSTMEHA